MAVGHSVDTRTFCMNNLTRCLLHTAACLALVTGGASFAWASDNDHERARQALARGDVLPLTRVLQHLNRQQPRAQILEVELEQKGERWIYEIKQLEAGGQLVKLKVDAKTGELLQAKRRGSSPDAKKP